MYNQLSIIITCEHGGNNVPSEYAFLFSSAPGVIETHRGYDPGALEMASLITKKSICMFVYETICRLLIDQNRSLGNKMLWSEWSNKLSVSQKAYVVDNIYKPYHHKVTELIDHDIADKKKVIHFSIHSFTPELDGAVRNNDVGILYDPSREMEKDLSEKLSCSIKKKIPGIRVRKNYPYKGTSDGLTKELRKKYGASYCGIELELNQKHFLMDTAIWKMLSEKLPECIAELSSGER